MPKRGYTKPPNQMRSRYRKMRVNGIQMTVHRHIMEQYLGRVLRPDELVHHINGDRYDNRLENLEIITRGQHGVLHNKGRKHSAETRAKVSRSLKGNQRRTGIPHSEETKIQIAASVRQARKEHFWSTKKKQ